MTGFVDLDARPSLSSSAASSGFVDLDITMRTKRLPMRTRLRNGARATRARVRSTMAEAQHYWHDVCANPRASRPPLVTLAYAVACIVVFYADDRGEWYRAGERSPWYGSLYAMVSHVNEEHLWQNVFMLTLLGWFLEATEGARHVASVAYAGGLLGAAYHGIARPHVIVKGASGAIYAIMWSQLSLLALNWFEMPKRWLRLALIVLLFSCDAGIYWCERRPNLSNESHPNPNPDPDPNPTPNPNPNPHPHPGSSGGRTCRTRATCSARLRACASPSCSARTSACAGGSCSSCGRACSATGRSWWPGWRRGRERRVRSRPRSCPSSSRARSSRRGTRSSCGGRTRRAPATPSRPPRSARSRS